MFSQQCNSGFCLARCALRCWLGGYVFSKEGVAFIVKVKWGGSLVDEGNMFLREVGEPLAQRRISVSQKDRIPM